MCVFIGNLHLFKYRHYDLTYTVVLSAVKTAIQVEPGFLQIKAVNNLKSYLNKILNRAGRYVLHTVS